MTPTFFKEKRIAKLDALIREIALEVEDDITLQNHFVNQQAYSKEIISKDFYGVVLKALVEYYYIK